MYVCFSLHQVTVIDMILTVEKQYMVFINGYGWHL